MPQPTIVVGVDDSPPTRAALRWAADLARSTGSTVRAVHVLPWPGASEVYACSVLGDPVHLDPVWLEDLDREACRGLFAEVVPEPGWTLSFAHGHVGRALVQESYDARALVLGAREHHGLTRVLHGSVGHYCLDHATCPVVAVPGPAVPHGPGFVRGSATPRTTVG
jgi:nucleotide-binding universal stress UspA family protein